MLTVLVKRSNPSEGLGFFFFYGGDLTLCSVLCSPQEGLPLQLQQSHWEPGQPPLINPYTSRQPMGGR